MLRLTHVRKTFGSIVAVDDLSMEIQEGEVFGLLGPNGAGKTTTVNMAVGLLVPDAGSVELNGAGSPTRSEVRRNIGVAPQALAIYDELTGEDNLRFFGKLYGLHGRPLADRVASSLDFAGLADRRRDAVRSYSGGMKRRLNLAVALIHDPPLLILDEPTAGMDAQSRNALFESVRALRARGRAIVYTTHYIEEAEKLCDRVGIIDSGKLLALDTVDRLIAAHGGKWVLTAERREGPIRIETDDPVDELKRLTQSGELVRFNLDRPNLESVFLNLTGRQLRD